MRVVSHVLALLGSRHHSFLVSAVGTASVYHQLRDGGQRSALGGGCWQPPNSCLVLRKWRCRMWCAGQMCAGDEDKPVSWS